MVFLHGTTIGEEHGVNLPIGNAARKLRTWRAQGAQIVYLTHRRQVEDVDKENLTLAKHGFPEGPIFHREKGEEYIRPKIRARIRSIVVKEGFGIDDLPDDLRSLLAA